MYFSVFHSTRSNPPSNGTTGIVLLPLCPLCGEFKKASRRRLVTLPPPLHSSFSNGIPLRFRERTRRAHHRRHFLPVEALEEFLLNISLEKGRRKNRGRKEGKREKEVRTRNEEGERGKHAMSSLSRHRDIDFASATDPSFSPSLSFPLSG